MSSNNRYSRDNRPRGNSTQQDVRPPKSTPLTTKKTISRDDAYSYALRASYLAYLLQPRQKRMQQVSAPTNPKPIHRTSAMDLLKDFSGSGRGHTSQKFPHGFMAALDKRVTGVLVGTEKLPEFNNDPLIKRSFGAFLNEFKNPVKRKSLERDRKMEDLLLIFYAHGVKELQKGKTPDDDSWKWMSDRHLAMFIRLISSILKDNDWAKDRPELANRLQTLEKKLLMHDMDLTVDSNTNGGSAGQTVEVEVPLSYEVKDMPLVLLISRIFGASYGQLQDDINQHKSQWTEEAALKDLKIYQQCISLKTKNTINFEDFDTESAYETWKKNEIHEVSQMLFAIMQIDPNLAKTSTGTTLPQLQNITSPSESTFAEISRTLSENPDSMDSFSIDHAMDFAAMNIKDDPAHDGVEIPFAFIPPDQRLYYKAIVKETLLYDIREQDPAETTGDTPLLSKKSTELLTEIASRWRVPTFSRRILLLDAIRELYEDRDIGLETVDRGFMYFKEMPDEKTKSKRKSSGVQELVSDWTKWTMKDLTMYQQCLAAIHAQILRDLFQVLQGVYGPKSPAFGIFMYVLTTHLYEDDLFPRSSNDLDQFGTQLSASFQERAADAYSELLDKHLPKGEEQWEFFHVIQVGKSVVALCDKIQKRYKKTPSFFGASPLMILVKKVLPNLAEDSQHLVNRIMENTKKANTEIPVEDGFELYREFVEIRNVHKSVLPGEKFRFQVEDHLQQFVWRWLQNTEESLPSWVEGAVKQDEFKMLSPPGTTHEEERHSVSALDIFRSFKETKVQLTELNWDDPYQYGKFMTRISKAISFGIARYCELLEQKFSQEMDRLTPEQEAALNQTQQERWMKIAKSAIAGTEKVEPFNFFPESLVKLNDIEYAMQNLDKLEQDIQVDKWAEIIREKDEKDKKELEKKNGPLPRRAPKTEKYVFTIKIIEAEDLPACDINGFSDPYVVLGDEFQKRLAKTRIIYRNLNPRWDETVDIITTGPLNIVATIWDWDRLGDHDCVGRTSLKLDPSSFRDFMPREYWLDLDSQGRLLLRVSMEGERDDIQFYFGKSFRALKRTGRDMTRNITDKLSTYIRYTLSREKLRSVISKGITGSVSTAFNNYFGRGRSGTNTTTPVTKADIENAITPLFTYFDENFAIMKQTLTDSAMIMVMTRLWKQILMTIEGLLVPPMSDKLSQQKPLNQQELDIVFKWLQLLFDFFHAVDEETGKAQGVPLDILKSPKYQDIINLNFFYFESTADLIRTSESIAASSAARQQEQLNRLNRLSAPATLAPPSFGGAAGLAGVPVKRRKTVMLSRNLGTMRQAKEEKRKAAQAEPSDEYILRILRMRPEAERYLRDRERQKQRLAAAQAAQAIVQQSLAGGSANRIVGGYGGR